MKGMWLAAAAAIAATPALAVEVTRTAEIAATPAEVWRAVGDFCGMADWHPAVRSCVIDKIDGVPVRKITLNGGADVVDRLVAWDDRGMTYTYERVEAPMPVENYVATLIVTPEGAGARATLTATFAADGISDAEAADVVGGFFSAGLDGLAASLE